VTRGIETIERMPVATCREVACFVGEAKEQSSRIPNSLQDSDITSDISK